MAGNKHLLFAATTCLGSAAVVFAMRTKIQVSRDLKVEQDSTISDVPDTPEIADKSVNDHADAETPLLDQRPSMSLPRVVHHDVNITEDMPKSDVDLPTIEKADVPVDFRRAAVSQPGVAHTHRADVSHPGVAHTTNYVQHNSSASPTHKAHRNTSFLDVSHRTIARDEQCSYDKQFFGAKSGLTYYVEKCQKQNGEDWEDVRYVSGEEYGRMTHKSRGRKNAYVRVDIGEDKYAPIEIDWDVPLHLGCFRTRNQQKCDYHLQSANQVRTAPSQDASYGDDVQLCCMLF